MKKLTYLATTAISILALLTCINADAANHSIKSDYKIYAVASNSVNCYQHATDVCIINDSSETIFFTVPTFSFYNIPLNPNNWGDIYSDDYYPNLYVSIDDAYYQNIFSQSVPNHSIIEISDGNNRDKLTVTVKH